MPAPKLPGLFCHNFGTLTVSERVFPSGFAWLLYNQGLGKKRSNAFCLSLGGALLLQFPKIVSLTHSSF